MKGYFVTALVVLSVTLSGCTSLSRSDEQRLRELRAVGIKENEIKAKSPATAGLLNILPGIGNFYLGAGTADNHQTLLGVTNFLLWPISPVWAVPAAVIDANTINKAETAYYYTYDPLGKKQLADLTKKTGGDNEQGQ
jgi:hypothetical protein